MSGSTKKSVAIATRQRAGSDDSISSADTRSAPSLKSPRTARFAEATTVYSPIEPSAEGRNPFADPPAVSGALPAVTRKTRPDFHMPLPSSNHYAPQPQVSDVGFGYMGKHESVEMPDTENNDYPQMAAPMKSPGLPLKSAMKTPGAPPRDFGNLLSPTFKEEQRLDGHETFTEKQQAKDIKVKTRVRIAKFMLRGVNFSCSLIVLSMLASTFAIFNATKAIPARNNLPPWAANQQIWPQVTLLVIACVSLFASCVVMWAYTRGGHRRAQKAAVYSSAFAVAFFVFSIVMWVVGAAILQHSKNSGQNKDMWGWSCVDNARSQLFEQEVSYDLICRLQNWSLICCIIEVVVELATIAVYSIIFYRFYSKRQLRKSMAHRDRARSEFYVAKMQSESAPNTPGFAAGPLSPRDGGYRAPALAIDPYAASSGLEDGPDMSPTDRYVDPVAQRAQPKPFTLQAPPTKNSTTPRVQQLGFAPINTTQLRTATPEMDDVPLSPREKVAAPAAAAPGETIYAAVPIPGAYEAPLSPGNAPAGMHWPATPR